MFLFVDGIDTAFDWVIVAIGLFVVGWLCTFPMKVAKAKGYEEHGNHLFIVSFFTFPVGWIICNWLAHKLGEKSERKEPERYAQVSYATKVCRKCDAVNPIETRFCSSCGESFLVAE